LNIMKPTIRGKHKELEELSRTVCKRNQEPA
jgi:hypothetical protein